MYYLVILLADSIYYICNEGCLGKRKNNGISKVLWTDGHQYDARIIAANESRSILESMLREFKDKVWSVNLTCMNNEISEVDNLIKSNGNLKTSAPIQRSICDLLPQICVDGIIFILENTTLFSPYEITLSSPLEELDPNLSSLSFTNCSSPPSYPYADSDFVDPDFNFVEFESEESKSNIIENTTLFSPYEITLSSPLEELDPNLSSLSFTNCSSPPSYPYADSDFVDPDFNFVEFESEESKSSIIDLESSHAAEKEVYDENILPLLPFQLSDENFEQGFELETNSIRSEAIIERNQMTKRQTNNEDVLLLPSTQVKNKNFVQHLGQTQCSEVEPVNTGIYYVSIDENVPVASNTGGLLLEQSIKNIGCKERKKLLETIRKRGDFEYNTYQEYNTGVYLVVRRLSILTSLNNIITTCPECKSFLEEDDLKAAAMYSRSEIRGKLNRTVPVLVHWELEMCLNMILLHRTSAGVHNDNMVCVIIRAYSGKCGATEPHLLRATVLRKHIATECALMDLSKNTIKDVAMFMGHGDDIHNKTYRLPVQTRDIVQMSRVLEMIQGGKEESDDDEEEMGLGNACDDLENVFIDDIRKYILHCMKLNHQQ
ncbi:hypothetical protein FQA39_LY06902 [Lamprigera yunnana]|nr:hypothetical protein FQA39_LY06902 [Lamprigera yunnana]